MSKYYRGRFSIGVYALKQEGETLLALCDTVKEFAKLMNIKETNARMILQKNFTGESKFIVFGGKFRKLEFIDMIL